MEESEQTAIKHGIKKWDRIAQILADSVGEGVHRAAGAVLPRFRIGRHTIRPGGDNCALCKLYAVGSCAGCPIRRKTKKRACEGTPWQATVDGLWAGSVTSELARHAARMAKFMHGLLKEGKP